MNTTLNYVQFLEENNPILYDSEDSIPNALPRSVRIIIKRLVPNFQHPSGEYMVLIWEGYQHETVFMDVDFDMSDKLQLISDLRLNPSHYPANWVDGRILMANAFEFAVYYLQD